MKKINCRTSELLAQIVDWFQFHAEKAKSDNPLVAEMAAKMCEVEIWEMWTLTQG